MNINIIKKQDINPFSIGSITVVTSKKPMNKLKMRKVQRELCSVENMGYYDIEQTLTLVNDEKGLTYFMEKLRNKHNKQALFIHIKTGSYAELSLSSIIIMADNVVEI